jgi:hypothetical protein
LPRRRAADAGLRSVSLLDRTAAVNPDSSRPRPLVWNDLRTLVRRRSASARSPRRATGERLLLRLAPGPERSACRRPRRSIAQPVVYMVEVGRLGRRFHALVTSSAAGGLGI